MSGRCTAIENASLLKPQTPETFLVEKQLQEQLYEAVMALPEKQAKRVYAHFYLGISKAEIAWQGGVAENAVRGSINRGLRHLAVQMEKYR